MQKNNAFCSICTLNYSAYAATLNDSLIKVGHKEPHYVLIIDYDIKYKEIIEKFNFTPVFLSELKIIEIDKLIQKYDAFELCNVLKPFFMEWLLINHKEIENLIYLDTDIYAYCSFTDIFDYLMKNKDISVSITPHIKQYENYNKISDYNVEILYMKSGLYNGGFYALKNDENTKQFLNWHKEKLFNYGYNAPNNYMFVDQKILDFAPILFNYVGIYRNKTYNVGHWNFYENPLLFKKNQYYIGDKKLTFFHFSNLKINENDADESILYNIILKNQIILKNICFDYWVCLKNNYYESIMKIPYKYINLYVSPPVSFLDPILHKELELEYLKKEIKIGDEKLKKILNSKVWKLTFPLRKMGDIIKFIKKNIK